MKCKFFPIWWINKETLNNEVESRQNIDILKVY